MAFAEDMSVFFNAAEFAVVASWAGASANVLFDSPTDEVLAGEILSTDYSVTLPHDVWPTIARDAVITIDGQAYTVRSVRQLNDGQLKRLVLTKGTA